MGIMKNWWDAILSVLPATLAPVLVFLKSTDPFTTRSILTIVVAALIGFAGSLVAYRSTKFAASKYTLTEKPIASDDATLFAQGGGTRPSP